LKLLLFVIVNGWGGRIIILHKLDGVLNSGFRGELPFLPSFGSMLSKTGNLSIPKCLKECKYKIFVLLSRELVLRVEESQKCEKTSKKEQIETITYRHKARELD
jgi:hypothetical protein